MITRAALAYVRNSNHVALFRLGTQDLVQFQDKYGFPMTVGCFCKEYPKTREGVGRFWMVHFHHAVVRDGVDAMALHNVLLDIPEFRDMCAYDIPGMDKYDDFNDL